MAESQKIQLHPLVVMNVADHFTRARYRQVPGQAGYRVIGVIFGRQDGRTLEIMNSVETKFENQRASDASVSSITIDIKFTEERVKAYKEMFPELDPVGWYSVKGTTNSSQADDQPTPQDIDLMRNVVSQLCENPLYLIMNPNSQAAIDSKKLPFFLYGLSHAGSSEAQQNKPFISLDYAPASEASEQIAVDGVANAVDPNAKHSVLNQRMSAPINAVKILRSKLNFIIEAVKASPEIRQNKNFMRRLNQIVVSTPITTQEAYDAQFFGEYSDAAALNMLTSVTQGCQQIQSLIDDFMFMEEDKMRGMAMQMEERMDLGGAYGRGATGRGMGGPKMMMRQINQRQRK